MHEILRHLPESACVLDVGCRAGSFDATLYPVRTIRFDRDAPPGSPLSDFVQGDVAHLPFRSGAFAAVISNHSMEHFEKLDEALREIARVVKPDGSIYVAVPDAGTVCDRVYRWLGKGGGHVNAFRSREEVIALIEQYTGLRIAASRSLMASFSFLNRKNWAAWAPRRLLLVGEWKAPSSASTASPDCWIAGFIRESAYTDGRSTSARWRKRSTPGPGRMCAFVADRAMHPIGCRRLR